MGPFEAMFAIQDNIWPPLTTLPVLLLQDLCEHSTGISSRSGVLSPSSLLANQSGEILGMAREMAQAKAGCGQSACGVEDVLQLLRILYIIGGDSASNTRTMQEGTKEGDEGKVEVESFCAVRSAAFDLILDFEELQFNAAPEEFTSKKITTKILQQIEVSFLFCFFFPDASWSVVAAVDQPC